MRWSVVLAVAAVLLGACGSDEVDPLRPPAGEEADPLPTDPAVPGEQGQGGEEAGEAGDALPDDRWTAFPEAPVALSEVAAASFGGQVWTAGGLAQGGDASSAVQTFDPTFGSWSAGPDLPEAVHHAALVSTGQQLYLIGGYVGSGFDSPTAAVRRLDPAAGDWEEAPSLPEPRAAGAAAWDGRRVVYGGGIGPGGLSGDVLVLDGDRWRVLGQLSQPREHLGAAGDDQGRVWFLAGRTAGLDTNVATVDLVEDGGVTAIGDVPTPRGGVAGFWSPAAGACVVGGEDTDGTFADVECIDADGQVGVLPALGQPRHGLGAAVADGIAYVLLGGPDPGLSVSAAVEGLRLDAADR